MLLLRTTNSMSVKFITWHFLIHQVAYTHDVHQFFDFFFLRIINDSLPETHFTNAFFPGAMVPPQRDHPGLIWHRPPPPRVGPLQDRRGAGTDWTTTPLYLPAAILGGAATCSEGFVVCFLKVPLACLGSMAAAVQPNSPGNSQKTVNKTFGTSGRPTQYTKRDMNLSYKFFGGNFEFAFAFVPERRGRRGRPSRAAVHPRRPHGQDLRLQLEPQRPLGHLFRQRGQHHAGEWLSISKVAIDTNILDLRTRYRTKLGWFFWF